MVRRASPPAVRSLGRCGSGQGYKGSADGPRPLRHNHDSAASAHRRYAIRLPGIRPCSNPAFPPARLRPAAFVPTNERMRADPQAAVYRPDAQISGIAGWLADPVEPADFPRADLRFRNRRWDRVVGLDYLTDERWVDHFAR